MTEESRVDEATDLARPPSAEGAEAAAHVGPGLARATPAEGASGDAAVGDPTSAPGPMSATAARPVGSTNEGVYAVSLPEFEGPLDLLLQLCQKHEIDILKLPISFITQKYLEYLSLMQLMHLDVAAEYLVMAATLAHIKSKMLLPAPPPGQEDDTTAEEEEDPREALIRRLLEYQKYKQAAADLAARGITGRDVFMRGMTMEEAEPTGLPPLAEVPLFSLLEAFQAVLSRAKVKITHDIVTDRITITDRIHELVAALGGKKRIEFTELFAGAETRFDLVITFLALLEMTRLRMTRLFQTDALSPIYIEIPDGALQTSELDAPDHPPVRAEVKEAPVDDAPREAGAPEAEHEEATGESPEAPAMDVVDVGEAEADIAHASNASDASDAEAVATPEPEAEPEAASEAAHESDAAPSASPSDQEATS